jgi:hypothetical protein
MKTFNENTFARKLKMGIGGRLLFKINILFDGLRKVDKEFKPWTPFVSLAPNI